MKQAVDSTIHHNREAEATRSPGRVSACAPGAELARPGRDHTKAGNPPRPGSPSQLAALQRSQDRVLRALYGSARLCRLLMNVVALDTAVEGLWRDAHRSEFGVRSAFCGG